MRFVNGDVIITIMYIGKLFSTQVIFLIALVAAALVPVSSSALTVSPVRLELNADPGQNISGEYRVTNDTTSPRTYYSVAENFRAQDDTGVPQFVREETGLASWVSGPESITLAPFETKIIPYSIAVPNDAKPGGYFAAQFWASKPQVAAGGNTVGYRLGVLMLLRVNGEISESGGLTSFFSDTQFTNTTPVTFSYRFNNDGDDRLLPLGDISIKNIFGKTVTTLPANPGEGNVLPVSGRRFDVVWEEGFTPNDMSFFAVVSQQIKNFHLGPYTATIDLTYGNEGEKTASATTKLWLVPTQLLLCVLAIFLVVFAFYVFVRVSFRRAVARQVAASNTNSK